MVEATCGWNSCLHRLIVPLISSTHIYMYTDTELYTHTLPTNLTASLGVIDLSKSLADFSPSSMMSSSVTVTDSI